MFAGFANAKEPVVGVNNTGGHLTIDGISTELTFDSHYAGLTKKQLRKFVKGHEFFNELWVLAPAPGVWGLGPTFNEANCAGCHPRNSRAKAANDGSVIEKGMLVKLGVLSGEDLGKVIPHPAYGGQLQNRAAENRVPSEGHATVEYEDKIYTYPDGMNVVLRKPKISFNQMNFGPVGSEAVSSLRIAPQVIGLGLLEWVPVDAILKIAEQQEKMGVSGKAHFVQNLETETLALGRFGWKATQPNIKQQVATAFHTDIGATTFFFPEKNCPEVQVGCRSLPSAAKCGGQGGCTGNNFRPEVLPSRLKSLTLYLQTLNIPSRRLDNKEEVLRGESIFNEVGCSSCHIPALKTGDVKEFPQFSHMTFHPFTDLLLHDLGEDLADGHTEGDATAAEWRTPPLWGIGLLNMVTAGNVGLLHDGRARNVEEAILWHGGEAEKSRIGFTMLEKFDRDALVSFVNSL